VTDPPVHPAAAVGFERAAARYERSRPSYPSQAVELIISALGPAGGSPTIELGAGTGKLTRLLAPSGVRVVAIEPVDAMRRTLRATTACDVVGAVAEALPFREATFGAAVAAQTFHWLDGDRTVPELARVLRPRGRAALVWNVRDESEPWVAAITDVIEPFRGDTPSYRDGRWERAFDASAAFSPLERRSFAYRHETTCEGVVERVLSISFIASLGDHDRDEVAREIRRILRKADVADDDAPLAFPYRTDLWLTTRR